ncbi:hypothetical protein CEXT_675341 [Caerostris extrusa]|uniref:Uncharacterized protein n=1 Tax=Caerostris extrusa TaxID=172846 RepID=A0AAV4U9Y3_CAEEX|nr:hypothetical protein CEXT_675341 [Caerostris extrusa]
MIAGTSSKDSPESAGGKRLWVPLLHNGLSRIIVQSRNQGFLGFALTRFHGIPNGVDATREDRGGRQRRRWVPLFTQQLPIEIRRAFSRRVGKFFHFGVDAEGKGSWTGDGKRKKTKAIAQNYGSCVVRQHGGRKVAEVTKTGWPTWNPG